MRETKEPGEMLIIGRNPVREALERDPSRVEKVMLQQGGGVSALDALRRLAGQLGVPVQYVPVHKLNRLAPGLNHQGAVAVAVAVAYRDVDEMLAEIAPTLGDVQTQKPILLVLDQVEDPYNFGAILRTAVAAGVAGVIVPQQGSAPLNAAALKTSAGTADRIPIARVGNLAEALFQLKERGYWVVGTDMEGKTSVWDQDWDRPLAIVMGSEGKGLRPRIAESCDFLVSIPLQGPVESLNVSVAAGITLFAAVQKRMATR